MHSFHSPCVQYENWITLCSFPLCSTSKSSTPLILLPSFSDHWTGHFFCWSAPQNAQLQISIFCHTVSTFTFSSCSSFFLSSSFSSFSPSFPSSCASVSASRWSSDSLPLSSSSSSSSSSSLTSSSLSFSSFSSTFSSPKTVSAPFTFVALSLLLACLPAAAEEPCFHLDESGRIALASANSTLSFSAPRLSCHSLFSTVRMTFSTLLAFTCRKETFCSSS